MSRKPKKKQIVAFRDAIAMTPDNLPDGAFWAMAHEIAGIEYGDGFDELHDDPDGIFICDECSKIFRSEKAVLQHFNDKHGKEE